MKKFVKEMCMQTTVIKNEKQKREKMHLPVA